MNGYDDDNGPRRILDLEGWLRHNSLRAPGDETRSSDLNRQEEEARFEEFSRYQQSVHRAIFSDDEKEEERKKADRLEVIQSWENDRINLFVADDKVVSDVPLRLLAESCDTVYALAAQWEHFSSAGEKTLHLKLERFPESSVQDFLRVVMESKSVRDLSGDAVVDCLEIAHYLNNAKVLEATVEILLESIDTSNCVSLCQLADQLHLPTLFERSLGHMMGTLDKLEENGAWDNLSEELQERVMTIKSAIQSSLHSQHSRLYFSSLDEYIAIFAERVQYYKERLEEAKEDQGRLLHGSFAWEDSQRKIARQEKRVRTLELAYAEQKKLFSNKRAKTDSAL